MSNKIFLISDALHTYLLNVGVRESAILTELREFTKTRPGALMQISPEQGQFMGWLVQLTQAKHILEVGTYTGYSSLVMALNLPEDGKIITCDIDPNSTKIAQQFWLAAGVEDRIEQRMGPALETLATLPLNHFDLIFIDADKRQYENYYEAAYQLLRPGGIILIDNVFWEGDVADESKQEPQVQAIRALNARLHADLRVHLAMIPIGDGLTLVHKK
jgi:predicted O-methyltransferase YrrM